MCLGAWALYKAKQDKNKLEKTNDELNCEAIPEMSLSKDYIKTWNRWNGNELPKQLQMESMKWLNNAMKRKSKTENLSEKEVYEYDKRCR